MKKIRNCLIKSSILFLCGIFSLALHAQETQWNDGGSTHTGSLSEALSTAPGGAAITLLSDVTLSSSITLEDKSLTLNGTGHSIKRGGDLTEGVLLTLSGASTSLTLMDVTLDGGAVWDTTSPQSTEQVFGNSGISATGALIKLTGDARLILEEGTIIENSVNNATSFNAGTINANSGHVIMNAGTIRFNEASANGGALFLNGTSSFIMRGGSIVWNTARNGGAVALNSTTTSFTFSGGTISQNRAFNTGYGGAIWGKGEVLITGGNIQDNYALKCGGAMYLLNGATFTGGNIENNRAAANGNGIYYYSGDSFIMGDSACLDADNEIFLISKRSITIASQLINHSATNKIRVNTDKTYDNTLVATFADSTKTAEELHEMAKEGLKYIEHTQGCNLSVSENSIVIGTDLGNDLFAAEAGATYVINRNGNTSAYIYETGSNLSTGELSSKNRCYWSFEPSATTAGYYYIKNATTGSYVQSTAIALSGQVATGSTPVEFRVAKDMTAGATTYGYYYLCSSDQTIDNSTDGTLGLNLGTGGVVAFHIKSGRPNSYWEITKTDYNYELLSFKSVDDLSKGETAPKYYFVTDNNRFVVADNGTVGLSETESETAVWYFVGESNAREGFIIANYGLEGYTLNYGEGALTLSKSDSPSRWFVKESVVNGKTSYEFIPYEYKDSSSYLLSVGGNTHFGLGEYRSGFAKSLQHYYYPCGEKVSGGINQYLTQVSITGENVLKELAYEASARPSSYYELYVASKGTVSRGLPFHLNIEGCTDGNTSNNILGMNIFVYFDWDGDAIFETLSSKAQGVASVNQDIAVPQEATVGIHRMRIRVTANELEGPEEDVEGCTYDFIVYVGEPQSGRTVTVASNDALRGTASLSQPTATFTYGTTLTATAQPTGNSRFLYWKEGNSTLSTDTEYTFTVNQNMALVAVFSPNTLADGVCAPTVGEQQSTNKTGIYDLRGNRIVIPAKGIYIINGNKKLIK